MTATAAPAGGAAVWPEARNDPRAALAFAAILCCAFALRWLAFGHPRPHEDEHFYLYMGHAMAQGAWPYADIWDRKPAGLFLIYAIPGQLPHYGAVLAYQAMALASATATAWLIRTMAIRTGWAAGALPAALLYLAALNLLGGVGGQAPVFYNLFVAGAGLSIIGAIRARGQSGLLAHGSVAMALMGIALTIKPTVVVEALFMGALLLAEGWKREPGALALSKAGTLLSAVALAPSGLLLLGFMLAGHGGDYLFAAYGSYFLRSNAGATPLENLGEMAQPLLPLLLVAGTGLAFPLLRQRRGDRCTSRFVAQWCCAALFALMLQRPWYDHYALGTLLPVTLACASLLGTAGRARRWLTVALVAGFAGFGINTARLQLPRRGTMDELAAAARLMEGPPGSAYVFGGPVQLYWLSGRCPATRWLFTSHLRRSYEAGAIGTDQLAEIRRIMDSQPQVVVMDGETDREVPGARAAVLQRLAAYDAPLVQPFGSRTLFV